MQLLGLRTMIQSEPSCRAPRSALQDIAVSTSLPIGDETWLKRSLQLPNALVEADYIHVDVA